MVLKPPKVEVGKMSFPQGHNPCRLDKGHNPINILEKCRVIFPASAYTETATYVSKMAKISPISNMKI